MQTSKIHRAAELTADTAADPAITIAAARKLCTAAGCVLRRTGWGGEYRVNHRGGPEATAYYTDDLQDAVDTAQAFAARVTELLADR